MESGLGPWAEVIVHHPMPLFHMEHCVIAALLSDGSDHRTCGRPCDRHKVSLRDRAGMDHPVEADVGCRNTVFHAAAQSAAGVVERCRDAGVRRWRIELVREEPAEVERLVTAYRALVTGAITEQELWRRALVRSAPAVIGYGLLGGLRWQVTREALRAVRVPTLVVYGDEGPAACAPIAQLLAREIPGARGECIAGAGHMLPLTDAERFVPLVRGHIERVGQRGTQHTG